MKNLAIAGISALSIASFGQSAAASTLDFVVDLAASSVSLTETGGGGVPCFFSSCGVQANLASGLGGTTFSLGEGATEDFDFITFSGDGTTGFNDRDFDITATLAFSTPTFSTTSAGSGGAFLLAGFITAGNLTWDDVPFTTTLADGSEVTVDFQGGAGLLLDGNDDYTTSASVTVNSIAAVPLPASGLLLLGGLALIGFARRRRKTA